VSHCFGARRDTLHQLLRGPTAAPVEAESDYDSDSSTASEVDCGQQLRTQTVSALRFAVQVRPVCPREETPADPYDALAGAPDRVAT
jgi:hypothetical protein